VPDPVPQAQQEPQLGRVAAPSAFVSAGRGPVQRAIHVTLLGEQFSHQVAGPGVAGALDVLPVELADQRLALVPPPQSEQGTGQRRPRVGKRLPAIRPGLLEPLGGDRGLVGEQPLLARAHVRLRPGHASRLLGRCGEMVHAQRGPPVITGARGVEFDLVEQVISQDNHVRGRTQVPGIQPFARSGTRCVTCGRNGASAWIAHSCPVRFQARLTGPR
jgi:hypothetical protein